MATLINTIIAFTIADSCVPLISNKVSRSRITSAGAFMTPWCNTPAVSVTLSKGEWLHSYGILPPKSLFKYSLQAIETVAAPNAYSIIKAQPIIQATVSPMVT